MKTEKVNLYEKIEELKKVAENCRVGGLRAGFKEIIKQIEDLELEIVQDRHNQKLKQAIKDFPIDKYIPELNSRVLKIENGCGTKRGWIEIYLSNNKKYSPAELRTSILRRQESNKITNTFRSLKFSDKKRIKIGDNNLDTIDNLLIYMSMDKIWTIQQWENNNIEIGCESYQYAYDEAIEEGYTDEEAEEKGQEAKGREIDQYYIEYKGKVLEAINYLLEFSDLELEEDKKELYINTVSTWKKSADKMAEIISGYGMFEYRDGKELKDGLPAKTYCEAIINHLHWLKHCPEIYGSKGYDYMMR